MLGPAIQKAFRAFYQVSGYASALDAFLKTARDQLIILRVYRAFLGNTL